MSFRNEMYAIPGHKSKPIMFMDNKELYRAYVSILIDLESAGVYESVAQGIREEWAARGLKKHVLNVIDKRFKNLKRKN